MNRYQKELKTLKRENQRLRKMLERAEQTVQEFCEIDLEEELTAELEAEEKEHRAQERKRKKERKKAKAESRGELCPDCGATTEEKLMGPFKFMFCVDKCGYRKKIQE